MYEALSYWCMRQVIPFARASVLLAADRAQLVQVTLILLALLVQKSRTHTHTHTHAHTHTQALESKYGGAL